MSPISPRAVYVLQVPLGIIVCIRLMCILLQVKQIVLLPTVLDDIMSACSIRLES